MAKAIDDAVAAGGDAGDIVEAEEQLDEGDVHRAGGRFADAAEAYADAVSTAVKAQQDDDDA